MKNGLKSFARKNFGFGSLKTDFEGRLEAKFTKSAYMDFVWRHNAEFLKRTDFGGKFSEQITDSTYMGFVI